MSLAGCTIMGEHMTATEPRGGMRNGWAEILQMGLQKKNLNRIIAGLDWKIVGT